MSKHPTTLMLSLIALMVAVMGLVRLQKVWRYILLAAVIAGLVIGWIICVDSLFQAS